MLFRVSVRGWAAPAGRRRRISVARLGSSGAESAGTRRRSRLFAVARFILRRLRLRALLLRSKRALARLGDYYADLMASLIAEAAAAEPVKAPAPRRVDAAAGETTAPAERPVVVVPAAVTGSVLRCNSHYYIR